MKKLRIPEFLQIISTLLFLFAGLGFSVSASVSQRQEFVFKAYPAAEEDCRLAAQDLGREFATKTGMSVLSSECRASDYSRGGYEIVVNYFGGEISDQPAAYDRLFGGYESGVECREDLEHQKLLFLEQTGHEVFKGYCSPKGYLFIYTLAQQGKKRLINDSSIRGDTGTGGDFLLEDIEETERQLAEAMTSLGAKVSRVLLNENGDVYIYYYAPSRLNLMFVQYTGYQSSSECQAEKPNVSQLIRTFDGSTLVQFCAASERFPLPGAELFSFVAYPYPFMFSQIYTHYMEDVGLEYESLEQCNADKPRIYDFYRSTLGKDVYGSNCTFKDEDQKYRLLIFREAEFG